MNDKVKDLLIQTIALFLILFLFIITHNEAIITISIIVLMAIMFKIKYHKGEWLFFISGAVIGFLFEASADLIFKLQYWENATLLGLFPIWLPLMWGYGFIFIRRLGNLIVKN